MMDSTLRTVNLDSQSLDKVIEALSDVVKDFSLTRRERISYRGLMLSADLAIAHFVITFSWLFGLIFFSFAENDIVDVIVISSGWVWYILELLPLLSSLILLLSIFLGVPSLLFSISLLRKTFRERAKLELLGITELTKSLWKESRRRRWLSRIRSGFLVFIAVYMVIGAVSVLIFVKALTLKPDLALELESALYPNLGIIDFGWIIFAVAVWLAIMLFTARYLRNQREQIDLAANAGQLRSVLEKMLQHVGAKGTVEVPTEFIEQAAKIESVQIDRIRKTAILKSVDIRSSGYAILFEEGAARQRSMLDAADRIELQDLEAKLSTEDVESFSSLGSISQSVEQLLRSLTKSGRVEIEFVINRASRIIRVTAVRSLIEGDACTPTGANGG